MPQESRCFVKGTLGVQSQHTYHHNHGVRTILSQTFSRIADLIARCIFLAVGRARAISSQINHQVSKIRLTMMWKPPLGYIAAGEIVSQRGHLKGTIIVRLFEIFQPFFSNTNPSTPSTHNNVVRYATNHDREREANRPRSSQFFIYLGGGNRGSQGKDHSTSNCPGYQK
jgi:hypothetical protein